MKKYDQDTYNKITNNVADPNEIIKPESNIEIFTIFTKDILFNQTNSIFSIDL